MKEASVFLRHIIESIEWIEREIAGMTLDEFSGSVPTQDAVIRRLEIIGEATKHLPAGLKQERREIPWDDIAGMRDVLIHEYFGVNIGTVWSTVKRNLPPLKSAVLAMLRLEPA
jgi:uncharacterized protein with HEPN domain